ncbi:MAG TPA: transporter substrate-binding domain-containing protein [Candidatus Deferrimicrobiaceae bacterium]
MKMRIAVLLVLVLACRAGIALGGDALGGAKKAADTLDEVRQKGVLVAGVREDAPPFGFRDDASGELVGLDVDLARGVAAGLGVALQVKPVKAGDRIPALLDGSIDLIAAKVARSPERAGLVDFSATYFTTSRRILLKRAAAGDNGTLEGRRIATIGNPGSARSVAARFPASVPVPFGDYPTAVDALKNGEVDALAGDGLVVYGLLAGLPEKEYAVPDGLAFAAQEYALAVRKGDKAFLAAVDQALDELDRSGGKKRIFDRWLRQRNADRPGESAPSGGDAGQASGVVVRRAATPGRFVVMAVKGMFRTDSEVSFYRPHGEFVGNGRVKNLYDDEVYIDGTGGSAERVATGDAVMMNYAEAAAIRDVQDREDFLLGVKASVKEEADIRREETGREFRQENADRKRYQEAYTMRKMELDYQYSDRDYYIVPAFTFPAGPPDYFPSSRPVPQAIPTRSGGIRIAIPKDSASSPNRSVPDAPVSRPVPDVSRAGRRGGGVARPPAVAPKSPRLESRPDGSPAARPVARTAPAASGSPERPKREIRKPLIGLPRPPERAIKKAPTEGPGDSRTRGVPR